MPCPNCGNLKIEVMDIGIVRWKQCSSCMFEFDFDGVESPDPEEDDPFVESDPGNGSVPGKPHSTGY